jgi:hypothetical protein
MVGSHRVNIESPSEPSHDDPPQTRGPAAGSSGSQPARRHLPRRTQPTNPRHRPGRSRGLPPLYRDPPQALTESRPDASQKGRPDRARPAAARAGPACRAGFPLIPGLEPESRLIAGTTARIRAALLGLADLREMPHGRPKSISLSRDLRSGECPITFDYRAQPGGFAAAPTPRCSRAGGTSSRCGRSVAGAGEWPWRTSNFKQDIAVVSFRPARVDAPVVGHALRDPKPTGTLGASSSS